MMRNAWCYGIYRVMATVAMQVLMEGNPVLATAYCLNAMNHARPHLGEGQK